MYVKQKANLEKYKAEVGATDDEIKAIKDGAEVLQYLKDFAALTENAKRAVNNIKQQVYNGDKNAPVSAFGGFPAFSPPHVPLTAGLKELALERNRRYKAASGYTKAIGIELGIEEDSQQIAPDSVKPDADYTPAASGYLVSVVVSNRGKADSWDVFIQRDGETTWTLAKTATGKSVDFTITSSTPGKPERVKAKVQLKKQNENYGQPSDIDEFTANP
jgi:hypothetical protein